MAESGTKRSFEENQDPTLPKKKQRSLAKKLSDKERDKTRINIGLAFPRWRALRELKGLQFDSELAFLLLDSYCQTISQSPAKQPRLERSSSTESCNTMDFEDLPAMSSSNEAENDTAAVSAQESTHEKEQEKRNSTCRGSTNDDQTTTIQSENKEIRFKDEDEDEEEEFSTSLSVADGHHLVDLGSSSEFIVDEECILELFKSCQKCNRRCTITKNIQGLKLVVYQTCCFCQNYFEWSNLPDEDDKPDSDLQIEGQNTATSPSSNRS